MNPPPGDQTPESTQGAADAAAAHTPGTEGATPSPATAAAPPASAKPDPAAELDAARTELEQLRQNQAAGFARLSAREKQIREREQALKRYDALDKARTPLEKLQALGLSLEDIVQAQIAQGQPTDSETSPELAALRAEINELKSGLTKAQEAAQAREQERVAAEQRAALHTAAKTEAEKLGEAAELVRLYGDAGVWIEGKPVYDTVMELTQLYLDRDGFTSEVLQSMGSAQAGPVARKYLGRALRDTDSYLEEQIAKPALATKRFGAKTPPASDATGAQAKSGSPTLNNRVGSEGPPPNGVDLDALAGSARDEALIERYRGRLWTPD